MTIRKNYAVHPINRKLSEMARNNDVIHDIDCIYRNTPKNFWMMFEWKNPGEEMSTQATLTSMQEMDQAFANASASYRGFFMVRFGFSIDAFPLDDTQQMEVIHMYDGILVESRRYKSNAMTAVQHILNYGRIL